MGENHLLRSSPVVCLFLLPPRFSPPPSSSSPSSLYTHHVDIVYPLPRLLKPFSSLPKKIFPRILHPSNPLFTIQIYTNPTTISQNAKSHAQKTKTSHHRSNITATATTAAPYARPSSPLHCPNSHTHCHLPLGYSHCHCDSHCHCPLD